MFPLIKRANIRFRNHVKKCGVFWKVLSDGRRGCFTIDRRLVSSASLNCSTSEGLSDDRLKASTYLRKVDLEIRRRFASSVFVKRGEAVLITIFLIVRGDKHRCGMTDIRVMSIIGARERLSNCENAAEKF
jgi:hypothetical protein